MDPFWRGEENVVQGKCTLAIYVLSTFQLSTCRQSCTVEKGWQVTHCTKVSTTYSCRNVLMGISVAVMQKSSGVLMMTS